MVFGRNTAILQQKLKGTVDCVIIYTGEALIDK